MNNYECDPTEHPQSVLPKGLSELKTTRPSFSSHSAVKLKMFHANVPKMLPYLSLHFCSFCVFVQLPLDDLCWSMVDVEWDKLQPAAHSSHWSVSSCRYREAELAHGRVCMLAVWGSVDVTSPAEIVKVWQSFQIWDLKIEQHISSVEWLRSTISMTSDKEGHLQTHYSHVSPLVISWLLTNLTS